MLTELFELQIAQTLQFMDRKKIVITEPVTWNLDGKAHPGPPVTVFDVSVGNETIIILDRDTVRCRIKWHPANENSPDIEWDGNGGMTHMTIFRALMHAIAETSIRM
jgi:hypothetical protein